MPKIIVKQGGQSREIPLAKETFSIGRTPDNDLEVKDSLISRRHSSIVRKGERFVVNDLGSANGTYVNRDRIETRLLKAGDVIRVGDTEITYVEDHTGVAKPVVRGKEAVPAGVPAGFSEIVQSVDEVAESFSISSKGISLKDLRRDVSGEKAARDSKMFFILFQVGKALSNAATLDDMLATALKLIFEVIHSERGVILLGSKGDDLVTHLVYQRGKGVIEGADVQISRTIATQVVEEKVSVITSDALQDPRFMQGLSIVQFNIRSALCVPLWEEREVYGAIYLDNVAKTYAFTKDDLELLTAIANLIAIRIRSEEIHARLRREEMLRSNLAKYNSPDVVNMLMNRGGEIALEVSEREVTVAFIDVESSTRLAETRGATEIAALLNHFFQMATDAVFTFNGNVNKFIGDEVMAIFNAPIDMPNHAEMAVRACIKLIQDVAKFREANPDLAFNVRCGVNTGPVVAGNVGTSTRMEYTVLGDPVNVAARLTKQPVLNSVVVGERTFEMLQGTFKARDLGEIVLRGRDKPLRAYEILP